MVLVRVQGWRKEEKGRRRRTLKEKGYEAAAVVAMVFEALMQRVIE